MLCLNALWALGEANVSDVRRVLVNSRPLAYTTVMTLLERLARKGTVTRRKVGRAFYYSPAVSQEALRRAALRNFIDCFFEGSAENLAAFLRSDGAAAAEPNGKSAPEESLDASLL